uniref:Uncharacterized protein n=1 Tax=Oryza glumipatula TaxID=40148 RepID=A0A0D9YQP3_9ORYZ
MHLLSRLWFRENSWVFLFATNHGSSAPAVAVREDPTIADRICVVCDEFWSSINDAGIRASGIFPPVMTIELTGVGADLRRRVERWRQAAAGGGGGCVRSVSASHRAFELVEGAYRGAEQASCGSRLLISWWLKISDGRELNVQWLLPSESK